MNKEAKYDLSMMQSLMERMDKHLTINESKNAKMNSLAKNGLILENRDGVFQSDNVTYSLSTPDELIKALSKPGMSPNNSWFVTVGYISKYEKLGKKAIKSGVDSFNQKDVDDARALNSKWLNGILDNQTQNKKGQIVNPFREDSYSNYIVEVSLTQLMYGRGDAYGKEKDAVYADLAQYQKDNPEDVKHYMEANGIVNFIDQAYRSKGDTSTEIPNTRARQRADGGYEISFNTPKTAFKKLRQAYFIITDEDNIQPISREEAVAYANLYGVESVAKPSQNPDTVVAKVDDAIKQIKLKHHGDTTWTNYNLDSVFLLNFTTEENGRLKLQYYNPDAIVEFVKGRDLKKGTVPSRKTSPGVFKKHLDDFRN